jgi:hypothetical protein
MSASDVQVNYVLRLAVHLVYFHLVLLPVGFLKEQRLLVMLLILLFLEVALLCFYQVLETHHELIEQLFSGSALPLLEIIQHILPLTPVIVIIWLLL